MRIARNTLASLAIAAGLVISMLPESAHARGKPVKTWTDPKKAAAEDPDFLVQGEYKSSRDGLQVVALGGGRFYTVKLTGGLPGDGWDGRSVDASVKSTAEVKGIISSGRFEKVERKSPTLGQKPPAGAVVLFDEKRASQTAGQWKKGKVSPDGYLQEGTSTEKKFGSFKLHLELRLPYKPNREPSNQDRGNSGVYIFNRYETQILDAFGLHFYHYGSKEVKDGTWKSKFQQQLGFGPKSDRSQWTACFYKSKNVDINMCYPPLTWQTYDITFTAPKFENGKKVAKARATVVVNGVKAHDDYAFNKGTGAGGGRKEVPEESIYLQGHGNPVRFRNIWLVPLD